MEKLKNWSLVRLLQLTLGLFLLGSHFFYQNDNLTLIFGGILLAQAWFNIGCPLGQCTTPNYRPPAEGNWQDEEVEYEEIKKQ